jgi:hypothetical protein
VKGKVRLSLALICKFCILLAFGFWLLAFGFWLLAFGFWLLAFGFWLLAFGFLATFQKIGQFFSNLRVTLFSGGFLE